MVNVISILPELEGEEQTFVDHLIKNMSDEQANTFAHAYRAQRRSPVTLLLLGLVGFIGLGGLERFYIEQIGMGILYLLTGGLCLIGTIIDLVNYRSLAFEYNSKVATRLAEAVKRH